MESEKPKVDTKQILENGKPGFTDTWQLILAKRGDENTVKLNAVDEGMDLTKPFPFTFSSHPGLGMVKGPDVHGCGFVMVIGDAENAVNLTVEKNQSDPR